MNSCARGKRQRRLRPGFGLVLIVGAMVLGRACSVGAAGEDTKRRPEVVVVYYPHWHRYDHGSAWKGEGWTEWEGVKAAVPRFPGHEQPLKPTWGYFDESDPQWSAREIDLAADHGIDVFLYDWYWYSGVKNMEEALEQGFLKAANRDRMKFALMWANHHRRDQFCPDLTKERTVWLPSRHSPRDLERALDYCVEHYFRQPNYWRVEGRLFFSIFQATEFVKQLGGPQETAKLLDEPGGLEDAEEQAAFHLPIVRLPEVVLDAVIDHALQVARRVARGQPNGPLLVELRAELVLAVVVGPHEREHSPC